MNWHLEEVPELSGFTVEWVETGRVIISRKNRLYQSATATGKREFIGEVKANTLKSLAAMSRLGQRLGRFMVYNAIPLSDGTVFVTFDKQIGIISGRKYTAVSGLTRPFRVLRSACAMGGDGSVYFGEYLDNAERGPMTVYRYAPGMDHATVAHTFSNGEVRHIHGVYADPVSNALWCVTGDGASESRIIRTTDFFRSIEVVGTGDESWRTVSLLFTNNSVTYASDAEFNDNRIYKLDRQTGKRSVVGDIDGPVYYSHAVGNDLFFAVTAELSPSQKLPNATLWLVDGDGRLTQIYTTKKDLGAIRALVGALMPGTMHFPAGPGSNGETYISGVGLKGIDNRTMRLYHD